MKSRGNKVVLCLPRAGLNDVLNQIARCATYASKHDRILIIDSERGAIGASIFDFLLPFPGQTLKIWRLSPDLNVWLTRNTSIEPEILQGIVTNFSAKYVGDGKKYFALKGSEIPLTFDMSRKYSKDILVHSQGGGGNRAITFLERMAFRRKIAEKIGQRVAALGSDYQAIHVRNTDMQTDYKPYFEELKPQLAGQRVLICSDDAQCKAYARHYFDASEVVEVTTTPDLEGKRLHGNKTLDPFQQVFDSFVDLMAMGSASALHFTSPTIKKSSGFSRLANALKDNPEVRDGLMTLARPEDRVTMGLSETPGRPAPRAKDIEPDMRLLRRRWRYIPRIRLSWT